MRNILILLLAGVLATGCNKIAGENLEHDMADMEEKWEKMEKRGHIWSLELESELADCRAELQRAEAKLKTEMPAEQKSECSQSVDSIRADMRTLDSLKNEWMTLDSLWQEDSVEWASWKEDWANGSLKIELARKDLMGWNNKHKDYSAWLNNWNLFFVDFKLTYHRHRRTVISLCGLQGRALK